MPSATTAESRLSTAAKSATVTAEGNSGSIKSARNSGMRSAGSPVGMPPKRLPMVSTGSLKNTTIAVPASSATIDPGTRFVRNEAAELDRRLRGSPRLASELGTGVAEELRQLGESEKGFAMLREAVRDELASLPREQEHWNAFTGTLA